MNGSLDLERRVTDWLRAEAPSRAPARILDGALDRVAVVGQERALTIRRYSDRSGLSRLGLVAATAALLMALAAAAMFVGSQIQGEDVPLSVPVAPPAFPFVPTAPPVPEARPPTQIGSGSAPTEIGQIAWTAVEGDATNIPSGEIFATPNGFAAVETDLDRRGSRFWQSPDGLSWSVTPMPVPAAGAVGHGVAAGEHWAGRAPNSGCGDRPTSSVGRRSTSRLSGHRRSMASIGGCTPADRSPPVRRPSSHGPSPGTLHSRWRSVSRRSRAHC